MTFDEIAREEKREQRVSCQDKNDREHIAAEDDGNGFDHGYTFLWGRKARNPIPAVSRPASSIGRDAILRTILRNTTPRQVELRHVFKHMIRVRTPRAYFQNTFASSIWQNYLHLSVLNKTKIT